MSKVCDVSDALAYHLQARYGSVAAVGHWLTCFRAWDRVQRTWARNPSMRTTTLNFSTQTAQHSRFWTPRSCRSNANTASFGWASQVPLCARLKRACSPTCDRAVSHPFPPATLQTLVLCMRGVPCVERPQVLPRPDKSRSVRACATRVSARHVRVPSTAHTLSPLAPPAPALTLGRQLHTESRSCQTSARRPCREM